MVLFRSCINGTPFVYYNTIIFDILPNQHILNFSATLFPFQSSINSHFRTEYQAPIRCLCFHGHNMCIAKHNHLMQGSAPCTYTGNRTMYTSILQSSLSIRNAAKTMHKKHCNLHFMHCQPLFHPQLRHEGKGSIHKKYLR